MQAIINLESFIKEFYASISITKAKLPWEIVSELENIIGDQILKLNSDFTLENNIAIHKNAVIEPGATLKGKIIISDNCFIGANAYLRGPIFLGRSVKVGPGSEIKQSIILDNSAVAHFNYIGNSIVGQNTNFEAGAICANHYNERKNKTVFINYKGQLIDTKTQKFGSLVGDNTRVGANAVLSPGTILEMNSIVKRLELIEQTK